MHKFTLLLKKESRSIIAFAILSAILVTLYYSLTLIRTYFLRYFMISAYIPVSL